MSHNSRHPPTPGGVAPDPERSGPIYVYIAGRGHSGSTLLTLLLARHPRIAAVGELSLLPLQIVRDKSTRWVGRCSCGERTQGCPVWGRVIREIEQEEGVDFSADPFRWRISDVGMEEEHRGAAPYRVLGVWLRNRFWRLLRYLQYDQPAAVAKWVSAYRPQQTWARHRSIVVKKLAAANGVDAIVDASKDPLDMLDVYHYSTVTVKVIFLTRDSRGNVWSILKRLKPGQRRDKVVVPAAREWRKVNRRIWRLVCSIPKPDRLHLRYEDICRDPGAAVRNVFRFLGVEPVDVVNVAGTSPVSHAEHTIGGNRIRFSGPALEIREDTAWRDNLSVAELRIIERITGPLSRKLGYE
jgi:hypothetical protein